jgi:hypothetical protein
MVSIRRIAIHKEDNPKIKHKQRFIFKLVSEVIMEEERQGAPINL